MQGRFEIALVAAILGMQPWVFALLVSGLLVIAVLYLRKGSGVTKVGGPGAAKPVGFFGGLKKTRDKLGLAIKRALGRELTEDAIDELETAMLQADMGPAATDAIIKDLKSAYREKRAKTADELMAVLKAELRDELNQHSKELAEVSGGPTVILVVGVNGVGKTTSIAKLTYKLRAEGKKVLLCAADTFRAAAVEQLTIWAERTGAGIVKGATGADPASVAHDGADAAVARGVDVLIVDTAGRLHTQKNLMNELEKIKRVLTRKIPGSPHETLLVLDATLGQNAVQQAKMFSQATDVTGVVLTKLDGTARGGVVIAIQRELGLPVKFVGLGEKETDLEPFSAEQFVEALFA
ncbi:MAG: signal recognition particle-docking protein FtsY [Planctomycetota bacterium]